MRDYLRSELGFDGVIISDYNAIAELTQHGVAADLVEAAALALKASVDVDMVSGAYLNCLPKALARGLVELEHIDAAVRRVLRLKQKLGLFDDPYRRATSTEFSAQATAALAADAARRSITLLANRDILPLPANSRRIAVIGPLADAPAEMRGPWALAGSAEDCVTTLAGLRTALPRCDIVFAAGVDVDSDDGSGIAAACALSADADVIVLCLGERADMSGEAASRATPGLPGRQRELAEAALATGVPVVVVLFSGRPLMITWLVERARAVVGAWFLGDMAGQAIADVLTGRFNPTARLPVSLAARDRPDSDLLFVAPDGPAGRPGRSLHQQISRSFGRAAFSIRTWALLQPRRAEEFASEPNGVPRSRLDQSGRRRHQHRKSRHRRNDIPLRARSCVDSGASAVGAEGLGEGRAGSQPVKGRRLHPRRR